MAHPFRSGETFANRNGAYEVLEVNAAADMLVIRYIETDRIVTVGLTLQWRIWENMQIEEQLSLEEQVRATLRDLSRYGKEFTGLTENDFSESIEGTSWRSRESMAGEVARLLTHRVSGLTFYSKAIYPWNQAYITHRQDLVQHSPAATETMSRRVKYRIELDLHAAYYGLYTERQVEALATDDWFAFIDAVGSRQDLIQELHLRMIGFSDKYAQPTSLETIEDVLDFFANAPSEANAALFVGMETNRETAIDAGMGFARQIADMMADLLPVYLDAAEG